MSTFSRRSPPLLAVVSAFAALAFFASATRAADRVYWANFDGPEPITYADLGGTAVNPLNIGTASAEVPFGTAIDPVGGRIYWASSNGGKIGYANLDGSGGGNLATGAATVSLPVGVAIDVAARRIYWTNQSGNKISWAALDGSGGGDLETKGATVQSPNGIAVDPATGRVYWTNGTLVGSISYADLGGGGGGNLPITGTATLEYPLGFAIDQAAKKIYWTNDGAPGKISMANLDGSGSHDLNTTGVNVSGPYGVAVDPESGRVFWGNTTTAPGIAFVRPGETGAEILPFAIPKGSAPNFPVLMDDPRATGAPQLRSGLIVARPKGKGRRHPPSKVVGATMRCSAGTWAGDLVESFLYRAPLSISYQWTRDGADIAGETSQLLSTGKTGNYRCRETATNWAGSTAQLSPVAAVFRVGAAKVNRKKGTARLKVEIPPESELVLFGKGVVRTVLKAAGDRSLPIVAKGKAKRKLRRTGAATVGVSLALRSSESTWVIQTTKVALRRLPTR